MKEAMKKTNKLKFILTFLFSTLSLISSYGVSLAFAHFMTDPFTPEKLEHLIIVLIGLFVLSIIAQYGYRYNAEVFYVQLEINAGKNYFDKLTKMKSNKLFEFNTGYITDLINEHALNTTLIASDIAEVFMPLIIGVGTFLYVTFTRSITLGLISLFAFILIITIRYFMNKRKQKYTANFYESQSSYKGILIDFISNIKTIIKLNGEKFAYKKTEAAKDKCIDAKTKEMNYEAIIRIVFGFLIDLIYITLFIWAIIDLNNGLEVLGYLMFYITIIEKLTSSLMNAAYAINRLLNYQTSKNKLANIIGELEEKELVPKFREINITDGIFKYPNQPVEIKIPAFQLKKKDKICITGESGQGKSTLLNILTGIYDLESGTFLIDNKENNKQILDAVYVSQEVEVFDLSIRDNILLGKDIPENKITEMFEDAGLLDWYQNLPTGLDDELGEKGVKVSVGQKQRLNIIRGILNDKELYIFDEPTSNLDEYTEELIVKLIEKYLKDKTFIIVTHREALKRLCNKHYHYKKHTLIQEEN